jgi:hypothetical protein
LAEIQELEEKMKQSMQLLKEIFELSIEIKAQKPENSKRIYIYWEDYAKHFLEYVKKRQKETGEDILGNFSFSTILKLFR